MTLEQLSHEAHLEDPKAQTFTLRGTPLLEKGRTHTLVAGTDDMTAHVKVYAEGGENASHTHLHEDHLFFVLQGEATFFLGRNGEESKVIGPLDGILLPKGAYYRFQSSGEENLVLFRTGSTTGDEDRLSPTGAALPALTKENNHVAGVPDREGRRFGDLAPQGF